MKKRLRRLLASGCVAAMLMTTPGMIVLADEVHDELILPDTSESKNPETIAGDEFIPDQGIEDLVPDTSASENTETIVHDEYTQDFDKEDLVDDPELELEKKSGESIDEEYVREESSPAAQEQEVGIKRVIVGDSVTATFDKTTGTVEFYSNGGTLYNDWDYRIGSESIRSVRVASGTVYLPEDSSRLFSRDKHPSNLYRSFTNLDLSGFDTSNVTDMSHMFSGSDITNLDLSNFNTSNVTDMSYMFSGCSFTNLDLSSFDTSNVTDMKGMFDWCISLTNLDLSGFDMSHVKSMRDMFHSCSSLTNLDLSGFDASNVTDMSYMFDWCENLTNLDLSGFDASNVTDMSYMFSWCKNLTNLNMRGFDASNVKNMSNMFERCESLTNLDLRGIKASNVTNMRCMFIFCYALTNLDLSSFGTSNVADMSYIFGSCESLTNLDLSSFDTSNVTDMNGMFWGNLSLANLDLSSFDTSNVTDMSSMFSWCESLTHLDLSNFDMSCVTDTGYMLNKCRSLALLNTPKKTISEIKLPILMNDKSGKEYSSIPVLSKSITLIKKVDINEASVAGISFSYGYSGKAYTPTPTLKINGVTLTKDKDYTVRYENNKNPGTATVTISGKGDYEGTRIKNFDIVDCVSSLVSGKTYQLIPKNNAMAAVCPSCEKMVNNTKIYIKDRSSSEAMKFKAVRNPDGTWKFINAKCELALAVRQNSSAVGADLVLYDQTGKKAQNWTLSRKSDNSFAIINAASGLSIALSNGSAARGTTLGMAKIITTGVQRFYFVETTPINAQFDGTKTVRPAKNTDYTLNISSSSKADGANVNLYAFTNTDEKKFRIIYSGGGYYRLINVNSGLCLTVKGNLSADGTNVIQSRWAAQSGQRWKIRKNLDGTVTITNALGTVLHLSGNKIANGTNIIAKNASTTSAQKWYLK